ncbi:hypothetical protein AGOR_G00217980 [Albula goreensis]|uniref:BTB domain-containing protein n=1 Tax=Albula goreensis TaxID=1534307 RepID=A0A8T3CR95_9TELE|nr:hypothetical protein AGOR_G00217980 [Albula goreensis]
MAGDCIYNPHYANDDTFGNKHLLGKKQELARDFNVLDAMKGNASTSVAASSPYFEIIDGVLYRKKLEKGYTNYREVLDKDRRQNAIATFHLKGKGHHTLEDTYRFVAENYWWEGMYFHIREYVLGCQECQAQQERKKAQPELCVSRTLASHGNSVLSKLRGQREAGLFCDITLKTSGRSFPAHKAVLAAVSEYFQEIFAEMDSTSNPQADIDLTGFSEEIFLPLLEFSYTSTLSLRAEDLGEVSTMARHFRMWAAVEACRDIQSEQRSGRGRGGATANNLRSTNCPPPFSVSPQLANGQQYRPMGAGGVHGKRKRDRSVLEEEPAGPHRKRLPPPATRERITHESLKPSEGVGRPPTRSLTRCLPQGENGLPLSPTRRLKLMDFKSPSSKVKLPPAPRAPSSSAPAAPVSPQAHRQPTRVLRSGTMAPQVRQPKEVGSLERKALKVPALNSTPTPSSTPSSSRCKQRLSFPEAGPGAGLGISMVKEEPVEEEVQSSSMLEKYRLLSVLGLQRKSLLPDPVQLTGWRQKKRLRKLKVSSYSLTARRKPRLARPVISPSDTRDAAVLPLRQIKVEPPEPVAVEEVRLKRGPGRGRSTSGAVEPQERRELRRSVRIRDAPPLGLPRLRARKAETGSRILRRKHVRVKREPATFAITPPVLPSCSTLGLHQGEPFLSLRARGSIPDSSPPSKSSARVGRRAKYNSTRPGKAAKRDRASVAKRADVNLGRMCVELAAMPPCGRRPALP